MNNLLTKIVTDTATEKDFLEIEPSFGQLSEKLNDPSIINVLKSFNMDIEIDSNEIKIYVWESDRQTRDIYDIERKPLMDSYYVSKY